MPRYRKLTANKYILTEEIFFRPELSKFPKLFIINLKKKYPLLPNFEYPVLTRLRTWLSSYYRLKKLISSNYPNQPSTSYERRKYKEFRERIRYLLPSPPI